MCSWRDVCRSRRRGRGRRTAGSSGHRNSRSRGDLRRTGCRRAALGEAESRRRACCRGLPRAQAALGLTSRGESGHPRQAGLERSARPAIASEVPTQRRSLRSSRSRGRSSRRSRAAAPTGSSSRTSVRHRDQVDEQRQRGGSDECGACPEAVCRGQPREYTHQKNRSDREPIDAPCTSACEGMPDADGSPRARLSTRGIFVEGVEGPPRLATCSLACEGLEQEQDLADDACGPHCHPSWDGAPTGRSLGEVLGRGRWAGGVHGMFAPVFRHAGGVAAIGRASVRHVPPAHVARRRRLARVSVAPGQRSDQGRVLGDRRPLGQSRPLPCPHPHPARSSRQRATVASRCSPERNPNGSPTSINRTRLRPAAIDAIPTGA
jgi:hypothetical protein